MVREVSQAAVVAECETREGEEVVDMELKLLSGLALYLMHRSISRIPFKGCWGSLTHPDSQILLLLSNEVEGLR